MLNIAVRRVAILAVLATTTVVTGTGCGTRPTASVGDPVILAAPAPVAPPQPLPLPQTNVPAPPPARHDTPATTTPASDPSAIDPAAVEAAAREVEPNTTLGAVVFDRVSGGTPLSLNADQQFRSASLVKLLIAIDALHEGVSESRRERLVRMLSASDDD